jgi:hypothetical protein
MPNNAKKAKIAYNWKHIYDYKDNGVYVIDI